MQQQIAVVTLGVSDLERSKMFYRDGFGWAPVFENEEIVFYQMNGLVFGTWLKASLEEDAKARDLPASGAMALAHNVPQKADVRVVMTTLVAAGATVLREADVPPQGGLRGYVGDPDGPIWKSRGIPHGRLTKRAVSSLRCDVAPICSARDLLRLRPG